MPIFQQEPLAFIETTDVSNTTFPELASHAANELRLRNGDLRLDAARQLVFDADGQIGTAGTLRLHTGGSPGEQVTVLPNGNVGIGTANPGHKLDIAGAINASAINVNGAPLATSQWSNVAGGISFMDGNVGIGTTASSKPLAIRSIGRSQELIGFEDPAGITRWHINQNFRGTRPGLNVVETGVADGRLFIQAGGNVGIGTTAPAARLDINGSLRVSGTTDVFKGVSNINTNAAFQVVNATGAGEAAWLATTDPLDVAPVVKLARAFNGSNNFLECRNLSPSGEVQKCHITKDGTFRSGSDFAEALPIRNGTSGYEPGDVLVLSSVQPGSVERSCHPFDARVVGVYSTRPAVLGADKDGETWVAPDEIPVAIVGIVPTKVSAENGPIRPGDLLTTAGTPSCAMKAEPAEHEGGPLSPWGAILGKALEGLEHGTGVIKVLLVL